MTVFGIRRVPVAGVESPVLDEVPAVAQETLAPPTVRETPPHVPADSAAHIDADTWSSAQRTLQANWQGSYVAPSVRRPSSVTKPLDPVFQNGESEGGRIKYPRQWLWDSGFHTQVEMDLGLVSHARTELAHLLNLQHDDGFIPDMSGRMLGLPVQITQPPNLGVTALGLARQGKLPAGAFERLVKFHDWIDRHADADGLYAVKTGLESGMDTSQVYDSSLWGKADGNRMQRGTYLASRLVYDTLGTIWPSSLPHPDVRVRSVLFNSLRAIDLENLAKTAEALGRPSDAAALEQRYQNLRAAAREKLADPVNPFLFRDLDKHGAPIESQSAAMFLPLSAGFVDHAEAKALVEHLTNPKNGFWTKYPIPSAPTTAPSFSPRDYWRGPVWMNVNSMVMDGLLRYGFYNEAKTLYTRSLEMLQQSQGPMQFNECYDPHDGTPVRQGQFGWSTLIVSMRQNLRDYELAHGIAPDAG